MYNILFWQLDFVSDVQIQTMLVMFTQMVENKAVPGQINMPGSRPSGSR